MGDQKISWYIIVRNLFLIAISVIILVSNHKLGQLEALFYGEQVINLVNLETFNSLFIAVILLIINGIVSNLVSIRKEVIKTKL